MIMHMNEINSDSSEWKYIHLSNGLIQSFEIQYEYAQVAVDFLWEFHTYPLFGGGLQLHFAIFKPGARLVSRYWSCPRSVCVCLCVCVCVSTPEASNNQWRDVAWYGPHMIG